MTERLPEGPPDENAFGAADEEIVAMCETGSSLTPMIFAATGLVLFAVAGFWAIGTDPSFSATEKRGEQIVVGSGSGCHPTRQTEG